MLYSRALLNSGYEVETAENGRKAIAQIPEFKPDLIILDLVMPEQEGIETLLQLHSQYNSIPVVAISGALGASQYLNVADLLGADATLTKPIKAEEMLRAIKLALEKKGRASAADSNA